MVVQHNLIAMNANRMLGLTTKTVSGSTEKLSSGYRINRAADDAAGLAISEKMRKQVRGLTQAAANAEDGISCVQTAEGALAEVQDMLQRMNELCVQAANGTNSKADRQYIQDELDQLVSEINRIAETTKFNETFLLKGDPQGATTNVYITNYSSKREANIVSNDEANKNAVPYKVNYKGTDNIIMVDKAILEADKGNMLAGKVKRKGDDITEYMRACEFEAGYGIKLKAGQTMPAWVDANGDPIDDIYSMLKIDGTGKPVLKTVGSMLVSQGGTAVTDTDVQGVFERAIPEVEIGLKKGKTAPIWYDNAGNVVAYSDVIKLNTNKDDIELTGTTYYKDSAHTDDVDINDAKEFYEAYKELRDNEGNAVENTTESLQRFYDKQGNYTGGLYWGNRPLTDEEGQAAANFTFINQENTIKATFDTDKYVAFVNVELNSNVATGSNGSVSSLLAGGNQTLDLSTNGIDEVVRANKELYIYNTQNDTVVHLHEGDEMTAYLTTDNEMDSKYRLVDYLSSENGTGEHVKAQITNNEEFKWTDNYVENSTKMQHLYDSNGQIVSGIALNKYFDVNGNYIGGLFTTDQARAIDKVFANDSSDEYKNLVKEGYKPTFIKEYVSQSSQQVTEALTFNLHVGAQSDRKNKITASIDTLTAAGIGIDKLASYNIGIVDETGDNATDAVDVVGDALTMISRQRSALGAVQNRLDHTTKNLDNIVENTTAAEAAIRDTDMATEMVRNANANILIQAGQAMLAQANQSNQGVLTLLQ